MRVLIVRAFPSIVDLRKNCYNHQEIGLATAFLSLGHEAGIVYYGGNNSRDMKYATSNGEIKIYYRKAKVLLERIAFFEDFSDLKEQYDLIISNECDQIETVKTLNRYAEKTVIYHGPYYSPFNKRYNLANRTFDFFFAKQMQKKNPCIVTKSRLAKTYLEEKGFRVAADVGVGINNEQLLAKVDSSNPVEGRLQKGNIHLLYVGRLEPRRNTLFLLDVLEQLVRIDSRYRLVMVGTGDKKYVSKVFSAISEKKLGDYIIYEESLAQNQLPYLYQNCDLFLLPTEYEIWGMVLMEAMRFNLPVITTYNGGSSTLINDGVNGAVLTVNVDIWVNKILKEKFDNAGLSAVNESILQEKCDWKTIAERIIEISQIGN